MSYSARNNGFTWSGNAAYNPGRVFHAVMGKDGKSTVYVYENGKCVAQHYENGKFTRISQPTMDETNAMLDAALKRKKED